MTETQHTAPRRSICMKCGGSGHLPHFQHVNNGVCYACNGTGQYTETVSREFSKGLFEIVSQHAIWQFRKHVEQFDTEGNRLASPVEDVLLQAVTGSGRKGKTLFRIRLIGADDVRVARRIYKAAQNNMHPDEMTNAWLGFTPGRCQIRRNEKGVSFL